MVLCVYYLYVYYFSHLFNKYLLRTYNVSGILLHTGDSKTDKTICLQGVYVLEI